MISVKGSGSGRDNTNSTENDTKDGSSGHNERTKSVNKDDVESPVS